MVKKRLLSAFIAASLAIPILYFLGVYAVYVLTFLAAAGCCYEIFSMVISTDYLKEFRVVGTFTCVLILVLNMFISRSELEILTFVLMAYSGYFLIRAKPYAQNIVSHSKGEVGKHLREYVLSVFCIVFLSLFFSFVPKLRETVYGLQWVILLMAVVWLGDTGAFFFGSKYGKKKLYTVISPGKSVEGSISGMFSSVAASVLCKLIFFHELSFMDCFNIGIIGGSLGQVGDLFESFVKRSVAVKDSGVFMPGHGGFLDRFDGIIFAAPFFYFYAVTIF